MKSEAASAIGLDLEPVAILFTDAKPEGAKQFKQGKWGCVMFYLIQRMDAAAFQPADTIDPAYGQALRRVMRAGVETLAYDVAIDLKTIRIRNRIPVIL